MLVLAMAALLEAEAGVTCGTSRAWERVVFLSAAEYGRLLDRERISGPFGAVGALRVRIGRKRVDDLTAPGLYMTLDGRRLTFDPDESNAWMVPVAARGLFHPYVAGWRGTWVVPLLDLDVTATVTDVSGRPRSCTVHVDDRGRVTKERE